MNDQEARKEITDVLRINRRFNNWMAMFALSILLIPIVSMCASAEEMLQEGKQYGGIMFACKTLEDANDVSSVHAVDGIDKAGDVFDKKEAEGKCLGAMAPFTPKRLASTAKGKETVYVIEVEVYGKIVYLITTASLHKGRET